MQKVNQNGGVAYKCVNDEQVTMTFSPHNTDLRVTYQFEDGGGPQEVHGDSMNFTMNQPLRILRVFFHFVNEAGTGGSYDVELSGSAGGSFPDPPPVRQVGDAVPSRRYAFIL
jgi:hypothetical protein